MSKHNFVICIENSDYPASLEKRKIYEVVPDEKASEVDHIRVIDESGEDYLYPASCFIDAHLTETVENAVANAA
ncbi:MAG: hypothetical protein R3F41_08790 [Gammaproteobacteria bacterium]|nr:hypothetical protein [Pseudomonadales bacterium]